MEEANLKIKKGKNMDKKAYEILEKNLEIAPVFISQEEYSKKQAKLCKTLLDLHDLMYLEENKNKEERKVA